MEDSVKKLLNRAQFLRHIAAAAEREYVAPVSAAVDEDEFEPVPPLHERLKQAADKASEAARVLADAYDVWEFADDLNNNVMADAKSAEWYDDAYVGYCDGMSG